MSLIGDFAASSVKFVMPENKTLWSPFVECFKKSTFISYWGTLLHSKFESRLKSFQMN